MPRKLSLHERILSDLHVELRVLVMQVIALLNVRMHGVSAVSYNLHNVFRVGVEQRPKRPNDGRSGIKRGKEGAGIEVFRIRYDGVALANEMINLIAVRAGASQDVPDVVESRVTCLVRPIPPGV